MSGFRPILSEKRPTNGPSNARETEYAVKTSPISIPLAAKARAYKGRIGAMIPNPNWAVAVARNRLAKIRFNPEVLLYVNAVEFWAWGG